MDEELDSITNLRLLRAGRFTKIMTATRRRRVAIMQRAMMPPWTILRIGGFCGGMCCAREGGGVGWLVKVVVRIVVGRAPGWTGETGI